MLNTNNTVNYEINVKRKEKKYSWSTVFAWLYLKTIGRILPKKWNKWAENILYYDKATGSNETHTDKTTDESAQIDLKPEVAKEGSQSKVISKDGEVQTNKVIFQDITMQTEYVETADRNIGADLESEVAEKGSQSEVMSEDEGIYSEVSSGSTDESFDAKLNDEFIDEDYNGMEEVCTEDDKELNAQLEDVNQELELEHSQNVFLKKENRELQSIIEKLEKDYRELVEVTDKQEKEFLVKLKAKSEMIECQGRELTELRAEFTDKINELLERVGEVRKNSLINQLQEEQKQVEDQLKADIKELQGEKENMEEQLKIDQGMCNQTQGGVNKYQLTEKAKKEYTPNSSMSHTNTVSVHLLNAQRVA